MKIFKFGGGILNSPETIRQLPEVLDYFPEEEIVIVISAFGKTTNALESLIDASYNRQSYKDIFNNIKQFHIELIKGLFPVANSRVINDAESLFSDLEKKLDHNDDENYDRFYDRIICYGELLSSKIIHHYMEELGKTNTWADARKLVRTDSNFRNARVHWDQTLPAIIGEFTSDETGENERLYTVTQGFIGSDLSGEPTSLGREGSDFTAAIFAWCLDASEVMIWKDVPGVLNADPKIYRNALKLDRLSYAEATELAYYGAKILHPKTIKPLKDKNIPLYVRSFYDPMAEGTLIKNDVEPDTHIPKIIQKFHQVLISVSPHDLSIITEEKISEIQQFFSRYSVHINILQSSALSLSLCIDYTRNTDTLLSDLREKNSVRFNDGLELITIRHYNKEIIDEMLNGKKVLLEQQTRATVQYVVRS
jgi:aspartate kinase